MNNKLRLVFVIATSLLVAMGLMIVPVPQGWLWIRPEFVVLVLIYWIIHSPLRLGVMTGFTIGLMMDLLSSMVLGKIALAMAVVAFLATFLRSKMRLFRFPKQFLTILVLVGFYQLILLWIQMILGHAPMNLQYWVPSIMSMLVAPLVFGVLHSYQRLLHSN